MALKILSGVGMKPVLLSLGDTLAAAAGCRVACEFEIAGRIRERLLGGEPADVIVLQTEHLDALAARSLLLSGSVKAVARPLLAGFVPAGRPKPDLSTVAGFTQALLEADSFAYTDPASGGISGTEVARILDQLGIVQALRGKIRLGAPGRQPTQLGIAGEIALGVVQLSEILGVRGIDLAGVLPEALQPDIVIGAATHARSPHAAAAGRVIDSLGSTQALAAIEAHGLQRVRAAVRRDADASPGRNFPTQAPSIRHKPGCLRRPSSKEQP